MADKRYSVLVDSLEYCLVCGRPYPHKHEIFFGERNRKLSIKHGFVIPLCLEHHESNDSPHHNREIDLRYKKMAQQYYEEHIGTREAFIKEFGKSYM